MHSGTTIDGVCRLSDRGLIRARGPEAASFLQGQLTNDVLTLGVGTARLAGFCSAKGRLQASFVIWKAVSDEYLLTCPASIFAPTLKRLSMFVLRAKCKLSDAADEIELYGVAGAPARWLGRRTPKRASGRSPGYASRDNGRASLAEDIAYGHPRIPVSFRAKFTYAGECNVCRRGIVSVLRCVGEDRLSLLRG